jgi:hypothetical protein
MESKPLCAAKMLQKRQISRQYIRKRFDDGEIKIRLHLLDFLLCKLSVENWYLVGNISINHKAYLRLHSPQLVSKQKIRQVCLDVAGSCEIFTQFQSIFTH